MMNKPELCSACRTDIEQWFHEITADIEKQTETIKQLSYAPGPSMTLILQLLATFKHALLDGELLGNEGFKRRLDEITLSCGDR